MNRSNKPKTFISAGGVCAALLSLVFCGIIMFCMFTVANIQNYATYSAALTFVSINLAIILFWAFLGKYLSQSMVTASFISACFITVVYTIIQFILMGVCYTNVAPYLYTLYHLILLFLYLIIIVPTILMGIRNNN